MANSRALTFGIHFGTDKAAEQLSEATEGIHAVKMGAEQVEEDVRKMGAAFVTTSQKGEQSFGNLGSEVKETAEEVRDYEEAVIGAGDAAEESADKAQKSFAELSRGFRTIGAGAKDFGSAIKKSMGAGLKETNSIAKSLRAGLGGALGYAENKVTKFVGGFKAGAKNISSAIQHPVQFLREKLGKALNDVGDDAEGLDEKAKGAGDSLEKAGKDGKGAGNKISESFKGAVAAIVGIEAIKAGIGLVKDFVGSALGAAASVESVGAKFDTVFGEDAGASQQWADNFSGAVHRSESEVKSFLVSSRAVASEMGVTGDAANDLAKVTTSLGYDLGAAFKMDDAEAMDALHEGLRGNAEAVGQFGISLDKATLKSQAMKMGISSEISELDDATLVQVRMNAILEQTASVQQAAAGEAVGLVNSTKGLKAIFTDFMSDAGAKFTPIVEGLFGSISTAWPTVEPMLMGLVDVLANGLGESVPVLLELGQNLVPSLTNTLGTLFEAGMPLISVFGNLAGTVLPPLAGIFGMIGETILPPLTGILDTLNTAVIQPLMPPLQRITEALLPPMAQLLGIVSPLLEGMSPVISFIGEGIAAVAESLGAVIGWVVDKGEKVIGFFSGLFGGAEKGKNQVSELSESITELDKVTDVSKPAVTFAKEDQAVLPAANTEAFTSSMSLAMASNEKETDHSLKQIGATTDESLQKMGTVAEETYTGMSQQSETSWDKMTAAAENGAQLITEAFRKIGSAALGVTNARISVEGVDPPHNAKGTDDFEGGWTHINEEGGELAFLPGGTAIVPADKSQQLVSNVKNLGSQSEKNFQLSQVLNFIFNGNFEKNEDKELFLEQVKAAAKAAAKEALEEMRDNDYVDQSIQEAY